MWLSEMKTMLEELVRTSFANKDSNVSEKDRFIWEVLSESKRDLVVAEMVDNLAETKIRYMASNAIDHVLSADQD